VNENDFLHLSWAWMEPGTPLIIMDTPESSTEPVEGVPKSAAP
jgi:hypothetical protein